jgi:predicted HicB family RNase H-like nuclease
MVEAMRNPSKAKARRLTTTVTISIAPDLLEKIKAQAAKEDRSVSGWITHHLKQILEMLG